MSSLPPPEMPRYSNSSQHVGVTRREGKVIASLVCGIVGFILLGVVLGAVALGLGYQARKNIKSSAGQLTGDGMALAGMILGAIDIAAFVFFVTQR
jgi:hypothetical protein